MVGAKILNQMGSMGSFASKLGATSGQPGGTGLSVGFSGTVFGKGGDGSATDRSTYLGKDSGVDKSFVSSGGGFGLGSGLGAGFLSGSGNVSSSQGAVSGIGGLGTGGLDSSLLHNNILSTPSSEKSHGRTSAFSPQDQQ